MTYTDAALFRLPFDQYGRYRMIAEALDAARPLIGERLRVLDVGGYHRMGRGDEVLAARLFLPHDDVTVLDQVDSQAEGYVRGDGRGLAYPDNAFDMVISCDTLEHVPAADRPAFWRELLRVARYGVVLAAPFASPEVEMAEALVRTYVRAELGVPQFQLDEHVAFGLPQVAITEQELATIGVRAAHFPTGYVHAWLAMMLAKHYLLGRTQDWDMHERLDEYYTRFLAENERCEPAYRRVWIVEKQDAGGWWQAAVDAIAPTIRPRPAERPGWQELSSWLVELVGISTADRRLGPLDQAVSAQARHLEHLQAVLAQRDAALADVQQRAAWLETQLADARRELAAVRNGRLLRILKLVRRR